MRIPSLFPAGGHPRNGERCAVALRVRAAARLHTRCPLRALEGENPVPASPRARRGALTGELESGDEMKTLRAMASGFLSLALATSAGAVAIDFRDASFAPGSGVNHHSVSYATYGFDLSALHIAGMTPSGTLYWDATDGFGIIGAGWENDEIELPEVFSLSFGETVYVESLLVTDLFFDHDIDAAEVGFYSVDAGASWTAFAADGLDGNGEMLVAVDANANQIWLTSAGRVTSVRRDGHEFSFAGIDLYRSEVITHGDEPNGNGPAVPEPSAALLFAAGAAVIRSRRAMR
jgi:hypothetical protein